MRPSIKRQQRYFQKTKEKKAAKIFLKNWKGENATKYQGAVKVFSKIQPSIGDSTGS